MGASIRIRNVVDTVWLWLEDFECHGERLLERWLLAYEITVRWQLANKTP
jgi:hypothetical protein